MELQSFRGGTINVECEQQEADLGQSKSEPQFCLMLPLQTALVRVKLMTK